MGTDRLGRDVAAGMIHGFRRSLTIGFLAMTIAGAVGFFLGALAGFWGDNSFKFRWVKLIIPSILAIYIMYFLTWIYPHKENHTFLAVLIVVSILFLITGNKLIDILIKRKRTYLLPVDILTMRTVELVDAVPGLLLILAFTTVIALPGIWTLVLIIPIVRWTDFTRFIRAEILKIKELNFVKAAYIGGQSRISVLFKYVLPEVIGPGLVLFAFGVSSTILLESTLSFLGIGVPVEVVTWGSMLNAARYSFESWWLAIFPGLAIFLTVTILNVIGDGILQAIDPKMHI
jgi:peptide/nickel transport system permease protein